MKERYGRGYSNPSSAVFLSENVRIAGQAKPSIREGPRRVGRLLNSGVEGEGGVGLEFEGLARGEVLKHDLGVGPLEIPAVFDGQEDIATGEKRGHRKRSVSVALVAVVERHVVAGILRNEKNHGSGDGLTVPQREAGNGAIGFGGVDCQVDGLACRDFDGAAGNGGATGFERADAEAGLTSEFHFVGACGKRGSRKQKSPLDGNGRAIGFAGLERAEAEHRIRETFLGVLHEGVGGLLFRGLLV